MSLARYRLRGEPQQKIRAEHLGRAAVVYLLTELQDVAAGQSADRRRASRPFGARPRDHDG